MAKILKATREDDRVILTVELESGGKEKWAYEREIGNDGLIHYLQVNKEDSYGRS